MQLMELSGIFKQIKEQDFVNCDSSNIQTGMVGCIPDSTINIKNSFDNPLLQGEYMLVCQKIVPWAWSKSLKRIKTPSKVIKINVQ